MKKILKRTLGIITLVSLLPVIFGFVMMHDTHLFLFGFIVGLLFDAAFGLLYLIIRFVEWCFDN